MGGSPSVLELSEPDPTWPDQFQAARRELVGALGPSALRIEHIGSTSVPGLLAKPTIDLLVVVGDTGDVFVRQDELESLGFEYRAEAWPDPTRHLFFRRVSGARRTHHVHVVPEGSPEIDDYLTLRDHLRCHPAEAAAYGDHKRTLERRAGSDRAAYVAAKPAYVESLLARAHIWQDGLEARFVDLACRNPVVTTVLERAEELALPDWILTAGCLFQSVWNGLDGREPTRGISDYDLFYYDGGDISWEAEDAAIRRATDTFAGCGGEVEVRNEARVHLWYENRFGQPCPAFRSSRDAIDHFAATTCSVGITSRGGELSVYRPFGLGDLFAFRLRPNPVLAPREVYESKAARWKELWPRLEVLAWPDPPP